MDNYSDSTDRSVLEYGLFAFGFVAFLVALSGVILTAAWLAVVGAALLVLTMLVFQARTAPGDGDH